MNWMSLLESHYNDWISIILMMVGFYAVINGTNLVKKLIGLAIFQTSVLLFYISASVVTGAHVPILVDDATLKELGGFVQYTNPLPHVLMLTAIVVGVATLSVGLAIVVRIKQEYGTVEEDEVLKADEEYMLESMREHEECEIAIQKAALEAEKKTSKKAGKA